MDDAKGGMNDRDWQRASLSTHRTTSTNGGLLCTHLDHFPFAKGGQRIKSKLKEELIKQMTTLCVKAKGGFALD